MKSLRRATAILALSMTALGAETVYLTPKGKTFHQTKTCMALSRATTVYTADRKEAEKHDLKPCGICYRKPAAAKATANDWAKPEEKK
jgi:hypothetical protein